MRLQFCLFWRRSAWGWPPRSTSWLCALSAWLAERLRLAPWASGISMLPFLSYEACSLVPFPRLLAVRWIYCTGWGIILPTTASHWIDYWWTHCFLLSLVSSWRGNCARGDCTRCKVVEWWDWNQSLHATHTATCIFLQEAYRQVVAGWRRRIVSLQSSDLSHLVA